MFSAEYDWGKVMIRSESSKNWHPSLAIMPAETGASLDIVYVEVCPGESTLTAEKITSVTAFDSDSMNTPTLAVRTDLDITSYQIGGARPSLPTKGQVWALVESGYITSIQIYNGSAWESCDGRIWTGSRWIPASSYNVITLQDMYDIVDATQNYEYIYSESGFWSWWQKSWNAFTEKLFSGLGISSGGSPGSSGSDSSGGIWQSIKSAVSSAIETVVKAAMDLITTVINGIMSLATDMLSFVFDLFSDAVTSGVKNFFSAFSDGSITGFFQQENEDGTTTTTLPGNVAAGMTAVSGFFGGLPEQLRGVLIFGIALLFLLAALKIVL